MTEVSKNALFLIIIYNSGQIELCHSYYLISTSWTSTKEREARTNPIIICACVWLFSSISLGFIILISQNDSQVIVWKIIILWKYSSIAMDADIGKIAACKVVRSISVGTLSKASSALSLPLLHTGPLAHPCLQLFHFTWLHVYLLHCTINYFERWPALTLSSFLVSLQPPFLTCYM